MAKAVANIEPDEPELFPGCTRLETNFVYALINNPGLPMAKVAELAGCQCTSDVSFRNRAQYILRKPEVKEALWATTLDHVKHLAPEALQAMRELVGNRMDPSTRLKTSLAILERAQPSVQKHSMDVTVKFDPVKITVEFLGSLKKQGWSREQLLTEFTEFELDHFEKILAKDEPITVEFKELPAPVEEPIEW